MSEISIDLSGKVLIITGSSAGIGAAIAIRAASVGAQVVITGSDAEKVSEVSQKCNDLSPKGLKALQVIADLSLEDDCKRLVVSTLESFRKINSLITNPEVVWEHTINDLKYIEKYKHIMETNLDSVVYLVHFCVPYLTKIKGNIVINSSVSGIVSASCQTPQCMSKSALDIFTRIMAFQLKSRGVRVNSINPGAERNNLYKYSCMSKHDSDDSSNTFPFMRTSIKSPRQVEHISNAILYLASDQASFVTGFNYIDECCCCKCFSIEIRAFYSIFRPTPFR